VNAVLGDPRERRELGLDGEPKLDPAGPDPELDERREVYCRTVT
jgi:hypothetical protein